jgi:hypothetical protein
MVPANRPPSEPPMMMARRGRDGDGEETAEEEGKEVDTI